jgi:uncharacterized protein (DUF2236 family)
MLISKKPHIVGDQFDSIKGMKDFFNIKKRLRLSIISMFSHGNNPMKNTLNYKGDPGLFGPDSQTWRIISDVSGFMGGIRALYLQAAHPEVVSGVFQYSNYKNDPFGRLSRTADYVAVTCFGAMDEVNGMIAMVKKMHQRVIGVSSRGKLVDGNHPELSSWVHNSLVESFLNAYILYGDSKLSVADANQFVLEQTKIGKLMGASELPTTSKELTHWLINHPSLGNTDETNHVVPFLNKPPLPFTMMLGYRLLRDSAIGSLNSKILLALNLKPRKWPQIKGVLFTGVLRQAMGFSPALQVAHQRLGSRPPKNRWFINPLSDSIAI